MMYIWVSQGVFYFSVNGEIQYRKVVVRELFMWRGLQIHVTDKLEVFGKFGKFAPVDKVVKFGEYIPLCYKDRIERRSSSTISIHITDVGEIFYNGNILLPHIDVEKASVKRVFWMYIDYTRKVVRIRGKDYKFGCTVVVVPCDKRKGDRRT